MYRQIIISSIILSVNTISAQSNIDSFLLTLHNKDVRFAIAIVEPKQWFDSATGKFNHSTLQPQVWSVNLYWISENFPKYLLVQKLVKLLDDTARDWYANLLLFSLTGAQIPVNSTGFRFFKIDTREKWLQRSSENTEITYKEMDAVMWRNYLSRISPSSP